MNSINDLTTISPFDIINDTYIFFIIVGVILLTLFAVVSYRNVLLLNQTIRTNISPIINFIGLLFLLSSIGTLFLTLTQWIKLSA